MSPTGNRHVLENKNQKQEDLLEKKKPVIVYICVVNLEKQAFGGDYLRDKTFFWTPRVRVL